MNIKDRIVDIYKYHCRDILNDSKPNTIVISNDLYRELYKTIEFFNENQHFVENKTFMGMQILIISNKVDYIRLTVID